MAKGAARVRLALVSAVSVSGLVAGMASAQQATVASGVEDIIVTAQRQAQSLQDVPIAITALSSEALERQQINNSSDLQLSLPNVSFTKDNFTGANFTIRGVGDLCVGFSCDTATGIHINDVPLTSTRIFETDFFDLERIEVLRGPQGTLFGRNATSGVINFITARPDLTGLRARGSVEYGNFDSWRLEGMVNVPLSEMFGVRVAGTYLKRDGFTRNLFTGNRIDGRDQWAVRGTLRFQNDSTTVDLIGYWFKEDSNRSRIQKQLCNRDPTGVLGCLPDRLDFGTLNGNSTLAAVLPSQQFLNVISGGALGAFGLTNIYGPDPFFGQVNPRSVRTVNLDYEPTYRSEEKLVQLKWQQDFDSITLNVTAGWQEASVRSRTDYNLAVQNPLNFNPGGALFAARNFPLFAPAMARLLQGNTICVSQVSRRYVGFINSEIDRCVPYSSEYDESGVRNEVWSVEAHIDSKFDGPFNFLLGGIYIDGRARDGDYYVASSSLDYGAAIVGAAQGGPGNALASPFFNSETEKFTLKAYGIFGEAYFQATDNLKFTAGLRYSNDRKFVRDRSPLYNIPVPLGTSDATVRPGFPAYRERSVKFDAVTGRFVIDWKPDLAFTDDTLVYASYSRGYKSGGINPPFNPLLFTAPATFEPEFINAFEIGMKNTFLNGVFRANLSAFYYDYKDLQISRIINRTSFNDNTNATIWGLEGEFIINPTPPLLFNISASYLNTRIRDLSLVDTRDPAGGRSDTVVIKDLQGAANCIVRVPGSAALANGFVTAVNAGLGLQGPVPIPATAGTGAFSLCSALAGAAANPPPALSAALGLPAGVPIPVVFDPAAATPVLPAGNAVSLRGNRLPNAPDFKLSIGAQYTAQFQNGWSAIFRGDLNFVGEATARSFNRPIDRLQSYEIVNAQVQFNSPDDRFFVRGFVQNLLNSTAVTGQYVTDPSLGLFTNIFTLEPRRYGVAVGFSF